MEVRFMYKYKGGEDANYKKQEKTPWYIVTDTFMQLYGWCAII